MTAHLCGSVRHVSVNVGSTSWRKPSFPPARGARGAPLRRASWIWALESGNKWGRVGFSFPLSFLYSQNSEGGSCQEAGSAQCQEGLSNRQNLPSPVKGRDEVLIPKCGCYLAILFSKQSLKLLILYQALLWALEHRHDSCWVAGPINE